MLCKRKVKEEQIECLIRHSIDGNVNSTSKNLMKFSSHKIEKKAGTILEMFKCMKLYNLPFKLLLGLSSKNLC